MACKIYKDPNNAWFTYLDWSEWVAGMISEIGGTVDITGSQWFLETGLTEDPTTPTTDNGSYKTFLYASGGTAETEYSVLNRITYSPSALTPKTFTEDRTITVKIKEK